MKTKQEKIDWLKENLTDQEKSERMTMHERARLQAFKNVMEKRALEEEEETEEESIRAEAIRRLKVSRLGNQIKEQTQNSQELQKPQFLTEAHRKNHEKAVKERGNLDFSKIDWEKEIAQQKINSKDD